MPQLSDLMVKKKFIKKEYRPWDLSGQGTVDGDEKTQITNNVVVKENESLINKKNITTISTLSLNSNVTDNELDNKRVTHSEQINNEKITQHKQPDNTTVTRSKQQNNSTDNVTRNLQEPISLVDAIKKLTGIQKNIFYYVINVCSARSTLDTGIILAIDLANAGNCTTGSAKTSLVRLVKKHLLIRLQGKASRGGHMILGITTEIQAAAIQAQQALFNPFKILRHDNNTGNITSNVNTYSSSIYKNIITTALPDEWQKINFEILSHIGFSETQLRQLFDSNMTTFDIVQDSINKFAYSLEYSDKVKAYSDPLNVLMGVLRKGQRWNEPNYVPPKELAMRQMLEEARLKKQQRETMIKELTDLEFPEWKRKLSEEQINEIVPFSIRKTKMSAPIMASLRTYFLEKILMPKIDNE